MALDLQDAAVRALLSYFDTALPSADADFTVPAVEGWPEWEEGASYEASPRVSVTPVSHEAEWHSPCAWKVEDDPAQPGNPARALVTYRVGLATILLQLDCWAPYKYTLAEKSHVVACALHNDLPYGSGLVLTMPDYYESVLSVYKADSVATLNTQASAQQGMRRRTWLLRAHMDLLCQGTIPRQALISLSSSITLGGTTLAGPSLSVP